MIFLNVLTLYQLKAPHINRGKCRTLATLVCLSAALLQFANPVAAQPKTITIGTEKGDRLFTDLWMESVYTEAFRRIGINTVMVKAPLKRLELLLERGEIDGELGRAPAYGAAHPQLLVVDVPILHVEFGLYSSKPIAQLETLDDLNNSKLRGSYRRGVLFCESLLSSRLPVRQISGVAAITQSIDMIAIGHADFFCDTSTAVMNEQYSAHPKRARPQKLFNVGQKVALNLYLHPKHAAILEPLTSTLRQMKSSGSFEHYRLETIKKLTATH